MNYGNYGFRGLRQISWCGGHVDGIIIGADQFNDMVGFPIYLVSINGDDIECWDIVLGIEGDMLQTARKGSVSLKLYSRTWVAYTVEVEVW